MGILVLTHNGLPPSQGGLRLGYIGGGRAFLPGAPSEGILLAELGAKKKAPPVVIYSRLPRARYTDGECVSCMRYPNPTVSIQTDEGVRSVVQCSNCSCQMRPF